MADGSITFSTKLDNKDLEKDLAKISKDIKKTEAEIEELTQKRDAAKEKSVFSVGELFKEELKLEEMKKTLQDIQATAKDTSLSLSVRNEAQADAVEQREKIRNQQAHIRSLRSEYNKVHGEVNRYHERLEKAQNTLEMQKAEAGDLARKINSASKASLKMADAQKKAEKYAKQFGRRLSGVVRSALVFTVITQALRSLKDWMWSAIKTNDDAVASVARLKGALLTLAQPLVEVAIPAFVALTNALTRIVSTLAQLFAFMSGSTIENTKAAAEALNQEKEALEGTGDAARDASKSLASFDEINKLSGSTSSGADSEAISPDFSFDAGLSDERLSNILGLVTAIGTALLAWRIGSALNLSMGQILGLALAIYSAVTFVKGVFDAWANGVNTENILEMLAGAAGIALGLGVALGPVAAGISLIVTGLTMLATGFKDAMETGWNFNNLLLTIAGILALGLGIGLVTGSWIPLLVAAIAGVVLALTVAFGEGESLIDGAKQILSGFTEFIAGIVSGDIGRAIDGIGNIFGGLNVICDAVFAALENMINSFFDWVEEKTGVNLARARLWALNVTETLKEVIGGGVEFLRGLFEGLTLFLSGVFTGDWDRAWEGIVTIGKSAVNLLISLVESFVNFFVRGINALIASLNAFQVSVPSWVPGIGGQSFGINIPTVKELSLPRLATGAVIPPNREFLAVLGDQTSGNNIETPEALLRKIVREESGSNFGEKDINITVVTNLDGKEVARNQVKHINDMTRQAGKPVLLF